MTAQCALYKWIEWAVAEISPFEIIQDGGLSPTWIWCNRKLRHSIHRPWKPYSRTKREVYRITRCGDMAIRVSWGHIEPIFWGMGGRRGQWWHHSKERWWFPIGCPFWPLRYLWPFGHNLRSNVSEVQINRGWVTLGQNFGVFPLE